MSKRKKNNNADFRHDLKKEILEVFQKAPKKPLNHKQVAAALRIEDNGLKKLIVELLTVEALKGSLKDMGRGKFMLAASAVNTETAQGIIDINRYGKGYVAVEGVEKDIEIPKGATGFALFGDTVEVQYNPKARRPQGKVIRVVERGRRQYVGIIEQNKSNSFMLPSDRKIHVDFFIPQNELNGAKHGEKVVVMLTGWDRPESSPFGKVVQVLGKPGEHQTEIHAIIAEYGLPYEFPETVEAFADRIESGITAEEIAKRRDFRASTTFTIDPFDAKDFDDALSYQRLPNGNTEVGIHIADVSFYLLPDSLLETEAFNRATSVYLVDRTIPMLPERLSNFLCSLRPNEEKLCFSAVFELDHNAEIKSEWFGRTVICSDRRYTYEEAQTIIETGKGEFSEEMLELDKLAKMLREKRYKDGSIDFNTDEVKFRLDEKGHPLGVYIKQMKDSNKLIEDFMLLANRRVAQFIGKPRDGQPKTFVYRIHDSPNEDKLIQLRTFLKHLGYKLPKGKGDDSTDIIKEMMHQVEGQPEEDIIRQMAIRTMAKAEYSTQNIGHYGLAFEYYTHFTSPIRRYPDVMVHRLLQRYLDHGKSAEENEYAFKCRHSSLMEKRAADAERASIKFKQVEYMLMHKGQVFEAVISGLAGWGIYAEVIENKCEGLIALNTLKDDIYEFDSVKYIIHGLRKRTEFRMGDKIMIKVAGGDLEQRNLDFQLVR
ncbi:MAG: ribonuclease R [Crocinitomicaceae bacterium]|nr:ribonuclease R [Crocinitomicaceae bacterium]